MANISIQTKKKILMKKQLNNNFGTLYLVATPIGNLNEVSNRTIETLTNADLIACEDTRNTIKLLSHFDIHTKMVSYHNFNEKEASAKLINELKEGKNIALVSDAGYPLISDPGFELVNDVIDENINIVTVSGPNAAINALVASGLETNHYMFYGFLNSKISQAKKELEQLKEFPYTIIFYEAPHRINKTLNNIYEVFGNRKVCVARELTKIHEEYIRDDIKNLIDKEYKGEIVLLVEGYKQKQERIDEKTLLKEISKLIKEGLKTKEAVKQIANKYNVSKNDIYNNYIKNNRNY